MARRKSTLSGPVYYTTYQVAKHLGVSLPTVVNWVTSGRLHAHRTPGGHRRMAHNDLIAFAREHHYPLPRRFLDTFRERRRVLVIDDERDYSEMVREYLSIKGDFDVEIADSGFLAGYLVAQFQPDLVLVDLPMADTDGCEILHTLRERTDTHHIPVIACTAYRDAEVETRIRAARFDAVLEKPMALERLLEVVSETLQIKSVRAG
jgi:excisionase family DNA binding protein